MRSAMLIYATLLLLIAQLQQLHSASDGKKDENVKANNTCGHCKAPTFLKTDPNLNAFWSEFKEHEKGGCRALFRCTGMTNANLEGINEPILFCSYTSFGVTCSSNGTTHQGMKVLDLKCEAFSGAMPRPRISYPDEETIKLWSPCGPHDIKP